jgi:serine phosphatase RsbU (regulator of sigma subunit)
VTTVTRIIGVIPTAVWLLIGALALAALAFATTSRLGARRVRRLDRQRRELLEDVGLLQAALLPELPARLGAVATTAAYRPASGPGAGGDFYDVFALPEGLVAVIVGDVSGHGRDALPHTTLLRYTLRTYLEAGLSPREALRAAAPALERQLGGSFATVVLATYDPRERLLTYSSAGHPHPLLSGLDPDAPIIACSAPPIGAGRPTGTRQTIVSIPGATVAAFYTDGVIEARTEGELYGQHRLSGALEELRGDAAQASTAAALLDRVSSQTDRRPDDMAACLLEISGGHGRPAIVSEEIELDGRESGRARARRFLLAAGVAPGESDRVLDAARASAADHGSALLKIRLGQGAPRLTLTNDNVAPLRARALTRTQEVAL